MAKVLESVITSKFQSGDIPTGSDFAELIENCYNKSDGDGSQVLADNGGYVDLNTQIIQYTIPSISTGMGTTIGIIPTLAGMSSGYYLIAEQARIGLCIATLNDSQNPEAGYNYVWKYSDVLDTFLAPWGAKPIVGVIANKAEATRDGWWIINATTVEELVGSTWSGDINSWASIITQQPYILGSNGEDEVLIQETAQMQPTYLVPPATGLTKPLTIRNLTNQSFYLKVSDLNYVTNSSPHCYIEGFDSNEFDAQHWFAPNMEFRSGYIMANSMNSIIKLQTRTPDLDFAGNWKVGLEFTNLIAYLPQTNGLFGNRVMSGGTNGEFRRWTLSETEYLRVSEGLDWFYGADTPINTPPTNAINDDYYLQSNGNLYQLQTGTWVLLFNVNTNSFDKNVVLSRVYENNTAALAGNLVAGDIYRTSTGVVMITF